MHKPAPVDVSGLFRELDGHLLGLLRSLSPGDWHRPTVCSEWCVKDIASHLLDGSLRRLSVQRDGYVSRHAPARFDSHEGLVAYLTRLNAEWTRATDRLSPRVLIALLEAVLPDVASLFESLDPNAPALYPVGWAGESASLMWFDVAREYTEHWHHHRQIADAVGRATPIDGRRLYYPVLDIFLRALPHTYRDVSAPEGTLVVVDVAGDAGGRWSLRRGGQLWTLLVGGDTPGDALVTIEQSDAWKLFTKRTDPATARARFPAIRVEGNVALGERVLAMTSIMA